ncbi:MAG: type I restriction endonuclease subunit R [Spirochaetales bacterium]|nr:type I restriction endonuclease subunit R [Spirochaetales bacterium]
MNQILSEKQYQRYIIDRLVADNGYIERDSASFDRLHAIDPEVLFRFLDDTQPKTMAKLRKTYKDKTEDTVINCINNEMTRRGSVGGSLIETLKHGVMINGDRLNLMYMKPATSFNRELNALYDKNILSVMEEVWASDDERIDLVLFLNGIAIMAFELKCNAAGQSYGDAIVQYRTQRSPKTRLFLFKSGVLVCFAMDLNEVYMTTRLAGESTFFIPFNMGKGEGINTGKGNPICEDNYSVHYMWDDILKKDMLIELISKFVFIEFKERKDPDTGKVIQTQSVIFPRYHQLDCVRRLLADVRENGSDNNYLLQHSTGSGKTNEIAWLSHRLASLHDADDKIIFDNIIICTDRVVVDRQLQKAITGIEHKSGLIRVMDDKCTSDDLRRALEGNTKIIATTIQKFLYIADSTRKLSGKRFAVIIDEAHSSTAGKDMEALTKSLSSETDEFETVEDRLVDEIRRNGKQPNVSIFAFTATPKPTTLQMFGRVNSKGVREAFHLYSMKQAIEEGFILDPLSNYICYSTFFRINKKIAEDPEMKTNEAKRQIARFIELHETNIAQRVEVIVEHFRQNVMQELGGNAKAMVITESRAGAVKYRHAFDDYIRRKGYDDVRALVAFSGKVKVDGEEYSEAGMNGFSEDKLPSEFNKDIYKILLVANKYQTGYDQPKLCAMYILKTLKKTAAVQTLSRLNRICPPYDKKTFVLDFANSYEDIQNAFAPYYTTTILANSVNPSDIYQLEMKLDSYYVVDPGDIDPFVELLVKGVITDKERQRMVYILQKCQNEVNKMTPEGQREFAATLRHFIRFYQFLLQTTCFEDVELHKKYRFLDCLSAFLDIRQGGRGFNLKGKIEASGFVQKKQSEHVAEKVKPDPIVKLPSAENFGLSPEKEERLSQIIREINSRTGKSYDNDVAVKAMLQIRDILAKNDDLRRSARNNSEADFAFAYNDKIDDALIDGLQQNKDFFSLLLDNSDIKKEVLGIFLPEIYRTLRA